MLTEDLRWPLWIRRILARVYSIGGSRYNVSICPKCSDQCPIVHSGTGVSGTVWLILFVGQGTREVIMKEKVCISSDLRDYR